MSKYFCVCFGIINLFNYSYRHKSDKTIKCYNIRWHDKQNKVKVNYLQSINETTADQCSVGVMLCLEHVVCV